MLVRSDIQIATIVKSLTDTVMPALGPDQNVASEQVGIIVGQLRLMAERAPLQDRFDLDEIDRLMRLTESLRDLSRVDAPDLATGLAEAAATAASCLQGADRGPAQVLDMILALRSACSAATTALYQLSGSTRQRLVSIVMRYSEQQLLRDRVWLVSQGWEANPWSLPAIEELLQPFGENP